MGLFSKLFSKDSKEPESNENNINKESQIKQMTQFWIGNFATEEISSNFFQEIYNENDDDSPLSEFIETQNEQWLDHDFMEDHHFKIKSEVRKNLYSYSENKDWLIKFDEMFRDFNENGNFTLVMSSYDFPSLNNKVKSPQSFNSNEITLIYFGEIKSPFM
ncbi:immunity 22 family protein [Zobellia sp. 1_MG-2023]|uniref:immunity 22 family protein n=1 Tax=Zobellia sp. 1_MG-2023 TaxID=3062626 RepID=UPI0026E3D8E8|nr:immunity 22 family protein [Zobellia sp. 1_MG-2023]MDO6821358.1 immunity 22 family protein [Zobellia sp. 1_MG-2023]